MRSNMLVTRIEIVDADGPEGVSVDSDNESDSEGEQTRLICCRQCNFSIDNIETSKSVYHNNYNMDNIKRTHLVNKFTAQMQHFKTLGIKCLTLDVRKKGRY